jgi:hypothetical protein
MVNSRCGRAYVEGLHSENQTPVRDFVTSCVHSFIHLFILIHSILIHSHSHSHCRALSCMAAVLIPCHKPQLQLSSSSAPTPDQQHSGKTSHHNTTRYIATLQQMQPTTLVHAHTRRVTVRHCDSRSQHGTISQHDKA